MVGDACVKRMADVHVAWQAWDSGCMSAFGRTLGGGFAWQVWGMVAIGGAARVVSLDRHGDSCTQRAFRVAGVGNGVTCCVAGHRFAWQAQGIAHGS